VAKQLLEVLLYARSLGISHRSIDTDCILVTEFDHAKNLIKI